MNPGYSGAIGKKTIISNIENSIFPIAYWKSIQTYLPND